jgi:isoquinoline 1-oxidoreductase beta subunit
MRKIASKHNAVEGFEGIAYRGVSRRAFLLSTTGAAVGIAFGSALSMTRAFAQATGVAPNAWMRVGTDGIVTIMSPASEMGQGVKTAMPLLIAEEMDLDWSRVKVEQAPHNPAVFGNPFFNGVMGTGASAQGDMGTGASRTTQEYYVVMRVAGMQARQIMIAAAAGKWGVPASEVTTEPHTAVHKPSGRRMGYGEIAAFAQVPADLPKVTKEQLKPASQFRLIGKDVPRVDVPSKVTGKAEFGIDVRLPGMLYGTVLRAPVQGEQPAKIDDAAAKKIPGVKAIVPLPYGVGVVAENYTAARKAKAALKVEWSKSAKARSYNSGQAMAAFQARARDLDAPGLPFVNNGDAVGALGKAVNTVTAEYACEHVAHACMEPMNATAQVTGDKLEIWAPTQGPSTAAFVISTVLGLFKRENIKVNVTLLGGGFGRRFEPDFAIDAAILAKVMAGPPVKVIWSREDDIQNDQYRPLVAQHLTAGVDAQGNLVALRHRIVSDSITTRALPGLHAALKGLDVIVSDGAALNYDLPNHRVEYLREERGVDVGFWRAIGNGYTKFATETLIDELAAAAGRDPVEYRLAMLSKQPRARAVIEAVAKMANWGKKRPAGRALGLAYSDSFGSHIAEIAEVSVNKKTGKLRVHEVWAAVDCGVAVQPKNVAAQIESSIMYGTSAALMERITFSGGEVKQSNFHDYPVLRMNEAPRVSVKVMPTDNHPTGVGETGLPPVGAAIANAVAALTGKRLRSLPLEAELLKA